MPYPNARPWNLIAAQLLICLLLSVAPASHAQSNRDKAARFYEDALQRYERKDAAGAIIQLKNALQIDKTLLPGQLLLGKALLLNAEAAAAEVAFNEALRLGADRAEVVVPLIQAMTAQGKQPQVLEDARLQPAGLPPATQIAVMLLRATAQSDVGDQRSALRSIELARAMDANRPDSWIAEVPVRIRSRQFADASSAADRAVRLAPNSSEAQYQRASVLHVLGQLQPALAAYDEALRLDAGHLEARLARAGIRLDLGQVKDAEADLSELKSLTPDEPRAVYMRALLAERAGNTAASQALLKQVTELLDPVPIETIRFRPQVLMLNGMAHYGLNELEKAKPYLEYALRQQPNSPLAKLLARIAIAEPNMTRAIELLEGYLKARPGDGQALLMLASAHMAQGRHAKATTLMQEALRSKEAPEFRTALGLSLFRSGRSGPAIEELERAFKSDPRQAYTGLALVNLYLRTGQTDKALRVADGLVKSMPRNPSALVMQGMAHAQARDFQRARTSYEQALAIESKLLEPQLGLARLEIASKDFSAARKRLSALLRQQERNVDLLFEMAVLEEAEGRNDEALKWLESAADASSQRETRANLALVTWHLRKGEPGKALVAAKALLAKQPEDVEALQVYAAAQLANSDLAGARGTLTNASRRAAFDAAAQVAIARAQIQAQDLAGAAYGLDKALSAEPTDIEAMSLMALVELRQGDANKAERRAQQIIATHPKRSIGHTLLAEVALSRRQMQAAIDALRRAHDLERSSDSLLRLFTVLLGQDGGRPAITAAELWLKSNPRDLAVQKAMANALAQAGNFSAARRAYEQALRIRADDTEALNNLANTLIRLQDPGALKVAEQAMAKDPRNPRLVDTAGWANHLAGNRDRALQLLRDARLRDPSNPEIRYHLAAVLAQAGRKAEARVELDAALRSTSGFGSLAEAKRLADTLK